GAGIALSEFVKNRIYRGLTTGLNEAFVIDSQTREAFLTANPESEKILKPFIAGKDIERWSALAKRWIIVTEIGVNMRQYPAVMNHLRKFEEALKARDDQGDQWWELRPCTYYREFEKRKIISTKVSIEPTFALDDSQSYLGNTSYFLPIGDEGLFLLGVLNSAASKSYAKQVFVGKQNGWYEVQPTLLEHMPIPDASAADRAAIGALGQKCLDARGVGCEAWEKEIDERVAALYGL
ncbi:MAG TPA: TaqI-like C-terminal specificity domain-containing protein, partial [Terriglobia bacterium]|nr:TaqI-like C-terminal specificity domain-containing protein [Terriglobia bacterium]